MRFEPPGTDGMVIWCLEPRDLTRFRPRRRCWMTPTSTAAILFDAGNTLVFLDADRMLDLFASVGVRVTKERFHEVELRARVELTDSMNWGSNGMEPEAWRRYFKRIFRGSGVPWWKSRRVAGIAKAAHRDTHLWTHVPEGSRAALATLQEWGYRLGVISNADGSVEGLLETVGLRPCFEFVIDSGTVPWEKPDPRIFHEALRRLDVEADEALYVGDLYHVDVVGARRAGVEAVLIDPLDRLAHDVDRIPGVDRLPHYLASR